MNTTTPTPRRTPAERNAHYCPVCRSHGDHRVDAHDEAGDE
jgi:ribosomal protein L44E